MNIKDGRIKVENEVLGGMKIIKLYAWERPFAEKITAARDRELAALWRYKVLQVFSRVLWTVVPTLVSIATFTLYTALGNDLTPAVRDASLVPSFYGDALPPLHTLLCSRAWPQVSCLPLHNF